MRCIHFYVSLIIILFVIRHGTGCTKSSNTWKCVKITLFTINATSLIKSLEEAADDIGLKINRVKCNTLIFDMKDIPNEIENIAVDREIKYFTDHNPSKEGY